MAVLQQYGFQGVDINWQYPKAVDKDKFSALVEVRLRLIGSTNWGYKSILYYSQLQPI